MDVRMPDGTIVTNVPEGTTQSELQSLLRGQGAPSRQERAQAAAPSAEDRALYDPTSGMSGLERFLAGTGKAMTDIGRGVGQMVGLGPSEDEMGAIERRDQPLMSTGAGMAGNVAGNVAMALPTAFIPGVNTLAGGAAVGSVLGAVQPVSRGDSRLENAAMGAGAGLVGHGLARGVGRLIAPKGAPGVREALEEGYELTPLQMLGKVGQDIERKATSVPYAGAFPQAGTEQSIKSFNKVMLNRALAPIGKRVDDVGHEGIEEVGRKLSQAYDDILPKLKITADEAFTENLQPIFDRVRSLPQAEWDQFQNILKTQFSRFDKTGSISGETMKGVESELGRLTRGYMRDASFDKRELGYALQEVQEAIRKMVQRVNPQYAHELKNINRGYAMYLRLQRAAANSGGREGVFTPQQLRAAAKALDKTRNKRAFSRGKALMQKEATRAEGLIGKPIPDSGTAGRAMQGSIISNLVGGAAALPAAALYSRAGRAVARGLLTRQPGARAKALAGQMRRLGFLAPAAIAGQ